MYIYAVEFAMPVWLMIQVHWLLWWDSRMRKGALAYWGGWISLKIERSLPFMHWFCSTCTLCEGQKCWGFRLGNHIHYFMLSRWAASRASTVAQESVQCIQCAAAIAHTRAHIVLLHIMFSKLWIMWLAMEQLVRRNTWSDCTIFQHCRTRSAHVKFAVTRQHYWHWCSQYARWNLALPIVVCSIVHVMCVPSWIHTDLIYSWASAQDYAIHYNQFHLESNYLKTI